MLEKKVRNNTQKNSLKEIDSQLKQMTISFIDNLNTKLNKNLFEEMKKEKIFPYNEFEKKYKELNLS
jgi:hypothetical protein